MLVASSWNQGYQQRKCVRNYNRAAQKLKNCYLKSVFECSACGHFRKGDDNVDIDNGTCSDCRRRKSQPRKRWEPTAALSVAVFIVLIFFVRVAFGGSSEVQSAVHPLPSGYYPPMYAVTTTVTVAAPMPTSRPFTFYLSP
ncbi:hypothetical protein DICA4_F26742 [Diutina catenulata]